MSLTSHVSSNYYRLLSTQTTLDLWSILDEMSDESFEYETETDFRYCLFETMSKSISKSVMHCQSIVDNAIINRLILSEFDQINHRFRFVANRDRNTFNELTHDWYCFECDSMDKKLISIELIQCSTCWRSFHNQCVQHYIDSNKYVFRCEYCVKTGRKASVDTNIDAKRLNKLLLHVFNNCDYFLNDEMRDVLSFDSSSKLFVFKPFDLSDVCEKIEKIRYKCLNDFETDVKHFKHNFVVSPKFLEKPIAAKFRKFEKHISKELDDLKICADCYEYSNDATFDEQTKSFATNEWFCEVCVSPHELVYAQIKGYSYWPSKVLRMTAPNQYDVRFFDPPNFTRGLVNKLHIKPITHRFSSDYILKWKLEQPIRLMMAYMNKLDSNGLVIEQTITNNQSIKYKDFVKMISPILNSLKRKNQTNNDSTTNEEKVVKKTKQK